MKQGFSRAAGADFFREVEIDYHCVAALLLSLLPKGKKLRLCIDRTEWDFGKYQVNILMVLVGCGQLQIPLYWELLDNKSGNSNADDPDQSVVPLHRDDRERTAGPSSG